LLFSLDASASLFSVLSSCCAYAAHFLRFTMRACRASRLRRVKSGEHR
jgi:hypothetical protein